jgi:hydroxysqualene synthase
VVAARADAVDLDAAYASCARDARGHYENFPVASVLVPRQMRRDVAAVYAFARAGDDFADEGERTRDERLALLDGWRDRLRDAAASDAPGSPPRPGEPANTVAIFLALGASIRSRALPVPLLEDLLSAFRQDVTVHRYETWNELLDYCRRSANPVGRLVLRIAGDAGPQLDAWSDAICTALQLTNFWQDREIDLARGRSYLPDNVSLAVAISRTRALFMEGRPLCDAVRGRLKYELRATWLGGTRILDQVEWSRREGIPLRPTLGLSDAPWFAARLLTWRTR